MPTEQPPQPTRPPQSETEPILGQVVGIDFVGEMDKLDLEPLPKLAPADGKCNARRTKARAYCKAPSMANGRCHKHGGPTPVGIASPKFVHGKTSKAQYLPPHLTARMERINGDVLENLEESIGIQKTLETKILEQMKTGESSVLWGELAELVTFTNLILSDPPKTEALNDDFEEFDIDVWINEQKAYAYDKAAALIREGKSLYAVQKELRKDIQSIHDTQRKNTETLTKCRKETQEIYTQEQWQEMMNRLQNVLREIMTREQLIDFSERIAPMQKRQLNP
jgi:hypothetical protein